MSEKEKHLVKAGPPYSHLMEEVKRRIEIIQAASNPSFPLPPIARHELCYIQLRKICELIALACVVAHGDLKAVKSNMMQDEWHPSKILKRLERLHRDFYPTPVHEEFDGSQRGMSFKTADIATGFLTKSALIELHGKSGAFLHRGSVRSVLNGVEPKIDFSSIPVWTNQIITLLNAHIIQSDHPEWQLRIRMNTPEGVAWGVFKRMGTSTPR